MEGIIIAQWAQWSPDC